LRVKDLSGDRSNAMAAGTMLLAARPRPRHLVPEIYSRI
jgi:hypothetical protein